MGMQHISREREIELLNIIYEVCPKSKCTDFPMYELVT